MTERSVEARPVPAAPSRAMVRLRPVPGWLLGTGVLAGWVGLWWGLVLVSGISPDLLPSPAMVVGRIVLLLHDVTGEGTLWVHVAWSLYRFLCGFLMAAVVAVPLGFAMAYFRILDRLVTPVFEFLRFVPPIAWAPFALLWFGANLGSQVFVIFVSAFPPILISAYRGIRFLDRRLVDAARSLGAGPWTVLTEVGLPASVPIVAAGFRIGLANGWMALVGAEIIAGGGTHSGLGYLILVGQQSLQANLTIGAMIIIGIVGALLDASLRVAERRLFSWR